MENLNKLTNGLGNNKNIFLSLVKKMDDKLHLKYNLPVSLECSGGVQDLCIVTGYLDPNPTKLTNSKMIFVFNKKFEELKELGIQNTVVEVYDYVDAQIEDSSQFFAKLVWVDSGTKKEHDTTPHLYLTGNDDSVLTEIYKRDTDGAAYFIKYTESPVPYIHYFLPTETNPEKYFDFNTVDFWNYDETETGYVIGHVIEFDSSLIISDTKLDAQVYMDEITDIHFANVSGGKSMIYTNFSGGFHITLMEYGEDPIGK